MFNAKKGLIFVGALFIAVCFVGTVSAADPKATKYGLEDVFSGSPDQNLNTLHLTSGDPNRPVLPTLIGNVIATGLSFIAIVFFVLVLYGGIMWMVARGNEDMTRKALKIIEAAIIGIIIVLGSYALTRYVMSSTKADAPPPSSVEIPSNRPASNRPTPPNVSCCLYKSGLTLDVAEPLSEVDCTDLCLNSRGKTQCRIEYVNTVAECQ